ncbi:MAG: 3-oxoacyl-ACP reductase [Planctomycetaceae bacterium]|nr:3-oxoacyl-ACP reductase [Planctomycetaceae bacterium]MDP7276956.1 SDR family oxidoreductase [Planctomycetaceae bacterium]
MKGTIFDLSGRVALVTGGSKGLGLAMARGFAEAGADVVISSRHQDELDAALAEISDGLDIRGLTVVADMTDREAVKRLAETALAEMGRVDVLVNNAGSNVPEEIDAITDENWDRIIELNLSSCMALTRELVPQMKDRGWGRVIHISSIMGLVSKEGRNAYSATKSGLLGLTRASALDLGSTGITVNTICPGPFLTDLPRSVLTEDQVAFFAERTALGRWGDPRELVGSALLLGSEAGSYITGTAITVDGGTVIKSF